MDPGLDLVVYAAHTQFYLCDADAELPTDLWTPAEHERRLAARPGFLGVGTGSYGNVRLVAGGVEHEPPRDDEHDHVVEAPLELPSGVLAVQTVEGDVDGGTLRLGQGSYRVRISWDGLELADPVLVDGEPVERCTIVWWPAAYAEPQVLRWYEEWAPAQTRPVNPWGLQVLVGAECDYGGMSVVGVRPEADGTDTYLIRDRDGTFWEQSYLAEPPYAAVLLERPPGDSAGFEPWPD